MGRRREGVLRYAADWRTLTWVALYYALTAALWVGHTSLGVWRWPLLLAVVYFSFAGAVITHNTMHSKVFYDRKLNQLFQVALTLSYGHPVSSYVPGHNLSHHKYTQTMKDGMRTSKVRFRWNLLNFLLFQPSVAGAMLKNDIRFLNLQRELRRPFFMNCMREFAVLFVVSALLIYFDWAKFLLYVHLPHFFAQWAIVTMNFLQHDGTEVAPQEDVRHINTARNFTGSIINFIAFNNGYHTVHHLRPTLHWSLTPAAHRELVEPKIDQRLNEPNMAAYIWRIAGFPARRVDFKGQPVVVEDNLVDEDWLEYPEGVSRADVEVSPRNLLKSLLYAVPLVPFKLACPTYSPVFKVD